jgi:hypothetical protein
LPVLWRSIVPYPAKRQQEGNMRNYVLMAAMSACLAATAAAAQDAPDMKGQWRGKTHTIIAGSGGHWPSSKGTFEQPALAEKDVVLDITGQQDDRFWGTTTLTGNGETTSEPFIGIVTMDGHRVLIADTDGYYWGGVDGETFDFCYSHAGGKTGSSVVNCTNVERQP